MKRHCTAALVMVVGWLLLMPLPFRAEGPIAVPGHHAGHPAESVLA
jgi:hypothetical protein